MNIKKVFNFIFAERILIAIFVLRIFIVEFVMFFSLALLDSEDISVMKVSGTFEDGYMCCFLSLLFIYGFFRIPMIIKDFFNDIDIQRKDKSGE